MSKKLEKLAEAKQKKEEAAKQAAQEYARELRREKYKQKKAADAARQAELVEKGRLFEELPDDVQELKTKLDVANKERAEFEDDLSDCMNKLIAVCEFMKTVKYQGGSTIYEGFVRQSPYGDILAEFEE